MPDQAKRFSKQSFFSGSPDGIPVFAGNTDAEARVIEPIADREQQQVLISCPLACVIDRRKVLLAANSVCWRVPELFHWNYCLPMRCF